jgi:hypothetical protein
MGAQGSHGAAGSPGPAARHTVDVDLFDQVGNLDAAEAALRAAVTTDVGDFFRFTLNPGRPVADRGVARRVPVTAFLGATRFARLVQLDRPANACDPRTGSRPPYPMCSVAIRVRATRELIPSFSKAWRRCPLTV